MDENIDLFVNTKFKSEISRRKQRGVLEGLETFLTGRGVSFATASWGDIVAWLQEIDKQNILVISKERYRRAARQFFRFLRIRAKTRDDNPVPERDEYQFTEKDRRDEAQMNPLDSDSASRVLEYFKLFDMALYIGTRILHETGMRIGELVSLKREYVHVEKRMLWVKGKMGIARYFVSVHFLPELERWVHFQEQANPDRPWLFPALYERKHATGHVTDAFFRGNLARAKEHLKLSCATNPHAWRDLINTARATKFKLHADRDVFLSILLCQVPSGVNAQHYLKAYDWKSPNTWEVHQKLYDELYPW